jgi:hypothetical protein
MNLTGFCHAPACAAETKLLVPLLIYCSSALKRGVPVATLEKNYVGPVTKMKECIN